MPGVTLRALLSRTFLQTLPDFTRVKRKKKKREFRLDSNDFGFISAGVSNMVSYKTNV